MSWSISGNIKSVYVYLTDEDNVRGNLGFKENMPNSNQFSVNPSWDKSTCESILLRESKLEKDFNIMPPEWPNIKLNNICV